MWLLGHQSLTNSSVELGEKQVEGVFSCKWKKVFGADFIFFNFKYSLISKENIIFKQNAFQAFSPLFVKMIYQT